MVEERKGTALGSLLRELLKKRSLSMRKLSEHTDIDTATISRIINGQRQANLQHLERFSLSLQVPLIELVEAAGYPVEKKQVNPQSDMQMSLEAIQGFLESSNVYDHKFSLEQVEQKMGRYGSFSQSEEGKNKILEGFDEKIRNVGSVGPFINQLKELFEKFRLQKEPSVELTIIGGALLYFIVPVDVVPDYLFPIGYIDDALAVQLTTNSLIKKITFD